jgi:hypothetical protein
MILQHWTRGKKEKIRPSASFPWTPHEKKKTLVTGFRKVFSAKKTGAVFST